MSSLIKKLEETLIKSGLPRETLKVVGSQRTSVLITCKGLETANKWQSLLTRMGVGIAKVKSTSWAAKKNRNTVLRPTMVRGYLVTLFF